MKEKRTNGGHMIYADYVVPVYNLNSDARHLTAYHSANQFVDVWAVGATLDNEYKSMSDALLRAENKYTAALENAPYNEEIRMNMVSMKLLRELFVNPKYHQVIDNELKLIVARYLREHQLKTDLDHAKYLVGFSKFAYFKENMH